MQFQYEGSGRPFAIQPYQYQSTFTPMDLGVVQHGLEQRQGRYDAANTAWAQTKAQLYDDPTYDQDVKKEVINEIENNFENVYKNYNGDLGAATGDLMQMIAGSRKNDYFRLNKVALEKQKQYDALKQAYGAKGLEFKGMKQGLKDENGKWRRQEDFNFDVVQDLERDKTLAGIIEQSLENVSREGARHHSADGQFFESHTTSGKGLLQGKGEKYDKTEGIYQEYLKTPEGQLHMRMLKELPGYKTDNPEKALHEYVDAAIKNRIAPPSSNTAWATDPEYSRANRGKQKQDGEVTFNSLGQIMTQHPDFAGVRTSSDLSTALKNNPNSIQLNKLNTKISESKEYQDAQRQANFNAREVWSYAKSKFGNSISLSDFPELNKVVNDPKTVVNSKELNRELITISDVFDKGIGELKRVKDINDKYLAFKDSEGIPMIPGAVGLASANYYSDKLAYDTDRDIRAATQKFSRTNPATKAIQKMLSASNNFSKVTDNLMSKPEYQLGQAVTMHMADELNTADNPILNAANKRFNDALPTYMLNAIDQGLLVSNDGKPIDKGAISALAGGQLTAKNMGIAYDNYGNIHFVVTGNKKGKEDIPEQMVFSFNKEGQNSDVANTVMQKLDDFSGGKISKLRSAQYEPVEGTNYIIDKTVGNKKLMLPGNYKISSSVGENGYTLLKDGKTISYYDYTNPKTDDDVIFTYYANFSQLDPATIEKHILSLNPSNKAKEAEEARKMLKANPVSFETGDEILRFTNQNK